MVRVFCDFDGTIAVHDVGYHLFRTFVGEKAGEIVSHYLNGKTTSRQCLGDECAAVESLTPSEFENFLEQFELDPFFGTFVEFCRQHAIPVTVLSDGLDFYVGRLLRQNGFESLPFFANHVEFVQDGSSTRLVPSFPYTDSECEQCANCKRNHILTLSADGDVIVYVGDGISDRCPVRYADIVFAKKSLTQYCQQQNITYFEYKTFADVQKRLEVIVAKKRIKRRREAHMARREVFMQG